MNHRVLLPQERSWLMNLLTQPAALLAGGFAALIVLGTIGLEVTQRNDGSPISWADALFHATSAVCVTGLSTFEGGAADFSRAGQIILLILIQIGGLGVMTFTALAVYMTGRGLSFSSHAALQDSFFQSISGQQLPTAIMRIVLLVVVVEAAGAVALYAFQDRQAAPDAGFRAIFLSISAFCNAGFSIDADSLISFAGNLGIMSVISTLIILGGLGYAVLFEVIGRLGKRLHRQAPERVRLSLHTRVVLYASLALTVGGFVVLLIAELLQQISHEAIGINLIDTAGHALFQSITARTAGFSTLDIGSISVPAICALIPLMFVGGSPGSCAGGVKTTSLVVWLRRVQSRLHGQDAINLLGRELPHDLVRRAALLVVIAVLWNGTGIMLLCILEPVGESIRFEHIMFEQFSALGTVGLSAGITPELSTASQLWLTLTMFVGRLGPLTMGFVVLTRQRHTVSYPPERVMIG
jgi:trk system potassium uptake protein TrkH